MEKTQITCASIFVSGLITRCDGTQLINAGASCYGTGCHGRTDLHWHGIVLDGVYTGFGVGESLAFHEATRLQDEEIEGLVRHFAALINGHLRRRGFVDGEGHLDSSAGEDLDPLGTCYAAAIQGLIPFGEKTGQRTVTFGVRPGGDAEIAAWNVYALACGDDVVGRRKIRVGGQEAPVDRVVP